MSNSLRKKKPKEKPQAIAYDEWSRATQEAWYGALYKAVQYSFWYVLYAPEYEYDFSEEEMRQFCKCIMSTQNECFDKDYRRIQRYEDELKTKLGFDCRKEAKTIPYKVKCAMAFGRTPKQNEIYQAMAQMDLAVADSLYLCIYSLYKKYEYSVGKVNRIYADFKEFVNTYFSAGMRKEHVVKFFSEVEQCTVIIQKPEESLEAYEARLKELNEQWAKENVG